MFRGAREQNVDYFDDIVDNHRDAGVFDGLGIADFDRLDQTIGPAGVSIVMNCHACGNRARVDISWEELYYVAANGGTQPLVLGQGWKRSDENLDCYVKIPCKCNQPHGGYAPHFTPDEAKSLIQQAVSSNFINEQQVGKWQQKIRMYRGAAG